MLLWFERIIDQKMRNDDTRTEADRDYARIIHSAAFRRLQSKTQVLGLGESDFYRTRLTHSMEVCQIGVGIMKYLEIKYYGEKEIKVSLPETNLIGAICLAHDIGHPPFGHGGEKALNLCMKDNGGFEGNAHTLRILSRLEKYSEKNGLNPIRRVYLGVLKYPAAYSKTVNTELYPKDSRPPKCYFDSEQDIIEWTLKPLTAEEKELFQTVNHEDGKHGKTIYKSLDTSIMELADDISYGLHDFEDAVSLKMITREKWYEFFDGKSDIFRKCGLNYDDLSSEIFSQSHKRKDAIGKLVNRMVTGAVINKNNSFIDPLIKYNAILEENVRMLLDYFKEIVVKYVIMHENVRILEYKGQKIITEMFNAYAENPEQLLSEEKYRLYMESGEDKRVICDFIAGMTDDFAVKMYERLFIPRKGSIFDRM